MARVELSDRRMPPSPAARTPGQTAVVGLAVGAVDGSHVVLGLALVLLAVSVTLYLLQRRQRRQVQALLDRLASIDIDGISVDAEADNAEATPELRAASDSGSVAPVGDVLAGRTSYVRRVVQGQDGELASLADQAVATVHRRLGDNLSPGQLAEELFISLRTLERGLASTLECTPSQLIMAMKMREARRLLKTGSYRVNEVASRLGFTSPYHFSRRFKSFYREAPSAVIARVSR